MRICTIPPTLNGFEGYIIVGSDSSWHALGEFSGACRANGTPVASASLFVTGAAAQERVVVSVSVLSVLWALQAENFEQSDSVLVVVIAFDKDVMHASPSTISHSSSVWSGNFIVPSHKALY